MGLVARSQNAIIPKHYLCNQLLFLLLYLENLIIDSL